MKTERYLLILAEILLNLLIFVICAVVCIGLLLQAHALSQKSAALTDAVQLAQTAAETWRAGGVPQAASGDYEIQLAPLPGKSAVSVTVLQRGQLIYTIEEVARP